MGKEEQGKSKQSNENRGQQKYRRVRPVIAGFDEAYAIEFRKTVDDLRRLTSPCLHASQMKRIPRDKVDKLGDKLNELAINLKLCDRTAIPYNPPDSPVKSRGTSLVISPAPWTSITDRTLFDDPSGTCRWYSKGPRAPFAWYGGKFYYAKWIISHFCDHRVFIEPFGGAGNIMSNKLPSEVEIFNDLDGRLVNFFRVLRDRQQFQELVRLCQLTPYSKEEFRDVISSEEPIEPVKRAWWFFVRCRQSIGGLGMSNLTEASWAISLRTRRKMAEPVSKYLSAIDGLPEIAERFRSVAIEQVEAKKLIEKHDRNEILFYCDPPYLPETRHGAQARTYGCEMSYGDHVELLEVLKNSKARIALSGYACELYDDALSSWRRVTAEGKSHLANSGQSRTEILWMNW